MLHIRPETVADYAAIARVNVRAFGRAAEAVIVDLHRHRARFDPELSLVAELDGRIVGHVLFSPQTIRLLGADVAAVNLAPIAIDPAYQRQGVGGALIGAGHEAARGKGYALSYLIGHPTYYLRFGYRTRAYGSSALRVAVTAAAAELAARPPTEADVPALHALWQHEEGGVDFAIDPGANLLEWLSPNPTIQTLVYLRAGEVVGCTRSSSTRVILFLARDAAAARQMVGQLGGEVELPLHPASASAAALGAPECAAWEAAMAFALAPSPFDEYYAQVEAGARVPGRPIWGTEFELE